MDRTHDRGFTLLETAVAAAIAVVLGSALLLALSHLLRAARLQSARDSAQAAILQLSDTLTTEEGDAWAIYVPPADVLGNANADGHEVDFFARDGKQQPYFWAYDYDAPAHTLTRYRLASPGGAPVRDVTYGGVTAFFAHTYPLTALQDPATPVYSALYRSAHLRNGVVHFYPGMPWIAGGNAITYVRVEADTFARDLQLVTATAPSGFTIVLHYTPSPSPSPALAAPAVWPAAVVFAPSGSTIAFTSRGGAFLAARTNVPHALDFGSILNGVLGGGVALAQHVCLGGGCGTPQPHWTPTPTPVPITPAPLPTATPIASTPTPIPATPPPAGTGSCTSVAYADGPMTQRLPAGTKNPYTGQVVVDANGCYTASGSSATFWVNESGYTSWFVDGPTSCGGGLQPGTWSQRNGSPGANGPTAGQTFTAGSQPMSSCSITFVDSTNQSATGYAAIAAPCWFVGGSCTWSPGFNIDSATCQRAGIGGIGGSYSNGWGAGKIATVAPSVGTVTVDKVTGVVTFTRTAPGAATVTARQNFITYTSAASCSYTESYPSVGSISYPSL